MAPRGDKGPSRAQLNKLSYQSHTPAFLQKFQNRMRGVDDDEDEAQYVSGGEDEQWEDDGSGRPPIPRRPRERAPIPERPDGDAGSADEEDGDELPQVVVLREGKHLTAWEAENVRRAEKGLSPLPDPSLVKKDEPSVEESSTSRSESKTKPSIQGLSFSSKPGGGPTAGRKRKAMGLLEDIIKEGMDDEEAKSKPAGSKSDTSKAKSDLKKPSKGSKPAKKAKKETKSLLSFGDDV